MNDDTPSSNHFLILFVVKSVGAILLVSNKKHLLRLLIPLPPKLMWDMSKGFASKDPDMREIRFPPKPTFIGSLSSCRFVYRSVQNVNREVACFCPQM